MTAAPAGSDALARLCAYAVAVLVHIPLILAAQSFGGAIAAFVPESSVVTMLDVPDARPTTAAPEAPVPAITIQQPAAATIATTSAVGRVVAPTLAEAPASAVTTAADAALSPPTSNVAARISEAEVAQPAGEPTTPAAVPVEAVDAVPVPVPASSTAAVTATSAVGRVVAPTLAEATASALSAAADAPVSPPTSEVAARISEVGVARPSSDPIASAAVPVEAVDAVPVPAQSTAAAVESSSVPAVQAATPARPVPTAATATPAPVESAPSLAALAESGAAAAGIVPAEAVEAAVATDALDVAAPGETAATPLPVVGGAPAAAVVARPLAPADARMAAETPEAASIVRTAPAAGRPVERGSSAANVVSPSTRPKTVGANDAASARTIAPSSVASSGTVVRSAPVSAAVAVTVPTGGNTGTAVRVAAVPPATQAARPAPAPVLSTARVAVRPLPSTGVVRTSVSAAPAAASGSSGAAPARVRTPGMPAARVIAAITIPNGVPGGVLSGGEQAAAVSAFARGYGGGGDCFAALNAQVSADGFGMSGFSRDEAAWVSFNAALQNRTGIRLSTPSRRISEAQCATLAFARRQPAYPDFGLQLMLANDRLPSGGEIRGTVEKAGDRPVRLLVVDDEGRVLDATSVLGKARDGRIAFATPLTLTSAPVSTVQLLVALAGDGVADVPRADKPLPAERYFGDLEAALKAAGRSVDIAVAAFTLE